MENAPPSLVLARELYTFSIGYYSKSKECLKVVKVLPDPCPEFTFQDDRINQKVLKKEKHVLKQDTLLLYSEFKKKHILEQDEMFCCAIISSGLKEKSLSFSPP